MGLIKGGFMFFVSSLLIFSILLGNLFITLSLSLDEKDILSEIASTITDAVVSETMLSEEIEANIGVIQSYCEDNDEFILSTSEGNVAIPCETAHQGTDAIVRSILDDQVNQTVSEFTGNSECNSPEGCVGKLLLSENASDYWKNYFYLAILVSFILAIIMFLLTEEKVNFPITLGTMIVISSLPFLVINFALPYLENSLLSPLSAILSESYTVFLSTFIPGITLIATGFGVKFFMVGSSISGVIVSMKNLFTGDKKETGISRQS